MFILTKVGTMDQVADILSKPLAGPLFKKFASCLVGDTVESVKAHYGGM
jgi:hypothetical protein